MPVAHVGLSRGPRPFPNGFRTGRTTITPPPPTPAPASTSDTYHNVDNRRRYTPDLRRAYLLGNGLRYHPDNRRRYTQ